MSNLPELLAELLAETDARDLVDRVGLDARYIEFRGHPVNVWNNVLRAARLKPGKLQAVVDAAGARYPDYTDAITKAHAAYLLSRPTLEQADRNRSAMLEKVRTIWITGFLQKSLFQETRILLGLSERTDAVVRPMDLLVQRPDKTEHSLPLGTGIVDVFDAMNQALLILGSPGSGKTTLLLEVARDLLDRATEHVTYPIPVVFPLSTWAESRRPMAEWLVDELNLRYDVPRKIGQAWVDNDQIAPLLDGLDEVRPVHRVACAEAINAFRQDHGLLPLVISVRADDYHALGVPLRLQGAIVVQPLTQPQVESYLTAIGPAGTAVREAIRQDPTLWDLLDTPLMLNIITVAYAGQPGPQPQLSGTLEMRRDHLFGAYVDQMFRRHGVVRRYAPQQAVHWLTWLARQMVRHSQTVFYIERLQPDWLPGGKDWTFVQLSGLFGGLFGGLVFGLFGGLVFGLVFGLVGGQFGGLVFGLVGGLFGGPVSGLVFGLFGGLVFGLFGGLVGGLFGGLFGGLVGGLVFGLFGGLVGELGGRPGAFDLRLMYSESDVSSIPTSDTNLVIVANVKDVLYFRIFDADCKVVVDTNETRLTTQAGPIADLKRQLDSVRPPHKLTRSEKDRVVTAVTSIVNHTRPGGRLDGGTSSDEITCVETFSWSRPKKRDLVSGLVGGLFGGLIFGLFGGLVGGLFPLLRGGLSVGEIETRDIPNQGIHRSAWNALVVGLVVGLVSGLVFGLIFGLFGGLFGGLVFGLLGGLVLGLFGGMNAGGRACLKHLALRLLLVQSGSIPWNYVKFLDYAAERILLRKVGGGYTFIHKMLLEYFAARYVESSVEATPNAKPLKTRKIRWRILYISILLSLDILILATIQAPVYKSIGDWLYNWKAYNDALANFDKAIRLDPSLAPAYNGRGLAWFAKRDLDKALADFDKAIRLDPKLAPAYNGRGLAWYAKQAYDKALADYDQAIRLDPKLALAYNNRGLVWGAKQDPDKALADFDKAIRVDPKLALAYNNRGYVWVAKQDPDKALADFDKVIRLDPSLAPAYNGRGLAWFAKRDPDKALADFDKAIRLDPKLALAYNNRGLVWGAKQDPDKALADFDQAICLDPKLALAYNNRGHAWADKQAYDKAIADVDQAIRLDPKNAVAYNSRAWLRATCPNERYRDGKRAVESATRACELTDWKEASPLDTLAAAYAECGDFAHAIEYQEKAQGLYKDEKDREKGRDRLALYREKKPYHDVPEAK